MKYLIKQLKNSNIMLSSKIYSVGTTVKITLLLVFVFINFEASKAYPADEITSLPGVTFDVPYKQYSGYLNASAGKFLHYWFVESQRSPEDDPVLLWLNGGPGCSSLGGMLSELGPFRVRHDGVTLDENKFSWNKVANILFLESPADVGFSFTIYPQTYLDDDTVSLENYLALQHFFKKFPKLKKNEFYVAGESYAGIYVPTLAVRIMNADSDINLKGWIIGNGYLDHLNNSNSVHFLAYYHGLISARQFRKLLKSCCIDSDPFTCNFVYHPSSECNIEGQIFQNKYFDLHLNLYNIYQDCIYVSNKSSRYNIDRHNLHFYHPHPPTHHGLSKYVPCMSFDDAENYLGQEAVRTALHVPSFVQEWSECNDGYPDIYKKIYGSVREPVLRLVHSGKFRGLIYNGDVDMMCTFLANDWFAEGLKLDLEKDHSQWTYNEQIAGFVTYYKNLTVLTVKGSGHMVPLDKPGPALQMISNFLAYKPIG